jgi:hypothetical protein
VALLPPIGAQAAATRAAIIVVRVLRRWARAELHQAHQRWCGKKVLSLGQKVSFQNSLLYIAPCGKEEEAPPKVTAVARAVLRRSGTCRPVGGARFRWASGWR